jgi:hypothetical protein
MTTAVDIVLNQWPTLLQKVAGEAAGAVLEDARLPPKTPPPPKPTPPADPALIATGTGAEIKPVVDPVLKQQAAENVVAPFHGQLDNIASGKNTMLSPADTSAMKPFLDEKDYKGLGLQKYFDNVDKMTPEQLARAMRVHTALGRTPDISDRIQGQRFFTNPMNPTDEKAGIDLEGVGGVLRGRVAALTPEELATYGKLYTPGAVQGVKEDVLLGMAAPGQIKAKVEAERAHLDKALKNPQATGFSEWITESWSNVAVPAGILLMLFGGDTGALLGGLAVAAGGYDLYNRYNVMTKDPAAQSAISTYVKGGMDKKTLDAIRQNYGDKYAKACLDFGAAAHYGFLSTVQNKYRGAGMDAYRSMFPGKSQKDVEAFGQTLPGATPEANSWGSDWANKAYETAKGWLPGTPAAQTAK